MIFNARYGMYAWKEMEEAAHEVIDMHRNLTFYRN